MQLDSRHQGSYISAMKSSRLPGRLPTMTTVVVVMVVIIGLSIPVEPFIGALLAAITGLTAGQIASAAGTAVSIGSSIGEAAAAASRSNYRVTCVIEMENWTKHNLHSPIVQITNSGSLITNPKNIWPASAQAFSVRKPGHSATGVYGTVSWMLGETGRRVVVMWSAPYSFNHYSNVLGVGLTRKGTHVPRDRAEWFNEMYYRAGTRNLHFARHEYYYDLQPVSFDENYVEVTGFMNNIHQAKAHVIVRPTKEHPQDLSTFILIKLEALITANSTR